MQKETTLTLQKAIDKGLVFNAVGWMPDYLTESVNISYYGNDFSAIQSRLTQAEILDYNFDSDEEVTATLYAFEGVPFVLYEKYGDRNGHSLTHLNKEVWKKFVTELFLASIEEQASREGFEEDFNQVKIASNNHYVFFSENESGANFSVHIMSPKWQMGYSHMFKTHEAQYQDQPVSFVRWANDMRSWEGDEAHQVIVMLNGQEQSVDGRLINFVKI